MKLYFCELDKRIVILKKLENNLMYRIIYDPIKMRENWCTDESNIIKEIETNNTNYKEIFSNFKSEYPEYFI